MPPLPLLAISSTLVPREAAVLTALVSRSATNIPGDAFEVVCAWPVSGQYGPGSRVLYYALVAACVLGQEAELIRKACLAAALLFPAVAALHGIVLAATHVNGAVDMDVYGAFQLCAVGVLAAPVTVRLSGTYFNDPGRNTIFVWSSLLLAGLVSLTVEFYRVTKSPCTEDSSGNHISPNAINFPYGTATCGLTCSIPTGPFSPIRRGSGNNIYVIPAPDKFSFGTATLVAAACCVPAILLLVSMWLKILQTNWSRRYAEPEHEASGEADSSDCGNGASRGLVFLSAFRKYYEVPVFGAAVLAVLVIGERNLFSRQVRYQTEPVVNIGQWAPIVGTGLALLGSLYLLLAEAMRLESDERTALANISHNADHGDIEEMHSISDVPASGNSPGKKRAGVIRPLARLLLSLSEYIGNPAHKRFDDSEFKNGEATGYPQIPGERGRNASLVRIETQWTDQRSTDRSITPAARSQRSRACSCNGSVASKALAEHVEGSPQPPEGVSPRRRDTLELPSPARATRAQDNTTLERTDTIASAGSLGTPAIVVSSTVDDSCDMDANASDLRLQAATSPLD